jgi:hypothetical protein
MFELECENLNQHPFILALTTKFTGLYQALFEYELILCLPKSSSLPQTTSELSIITEYFIQSHVLQPGDSLLQIPTTQQPGGNPVQKSFPFSLTRNSSPSTSGANTPSSMIKKSESASSFSSLLSGVKNSFMKELPPLPPPAIQTGNIPIFNTLNNKSVQLSESSISTLAGSP